MYRAPPSETMRRSLSHLFGRKHGAPIERAVAAGTVQTRESAVRHRIEDAHDARRLRDETDWLD